MLFLYNYLLNYMKRGMGVESSNSIELKSEINVLLPELIMEIFLRLPLTCRSLLNCRQVSKNWFELSNDKMIWDYLFNFTFGKLRKNNELWTESIYKAYHLDTINLNPNELLRFSIKNNCIGLANSLIVKHKEQPIKSSNRESNHIYLASVRGLTEIVESLITNNYYKPDDTLDGDSTSLYIACQENYLDTVKVLIKHKANIEFSFREGFTPLYVACQRGNIDIVKYLIDCGANVNAACNQGSTPLYIASQEGRTDVIHLLCTRGANVEAKFRRGFTPLYVACRNGHFNAVTKLISFGVNVNACDDDGSTPIYVACQNGYHEIVKLLIEVKASPNITFLGGYTPLYVACQNGHHESALQLLQGGKVRIDVVATNRASSLYIACQNGYHKVVSYLLDYNADATITPSGFSPLYIAVHKRHFEIVKELLTRSNVDINYSSDVQPHVLYAACRDNLLDIANLLMSHRANIDNVKFTDYNQNLLHMAFEEHFSEQIIFWLLDTFPQLLFERNKDGITPIDMANNYKNDNVLMKTMELVSLMQC